MTEILTIEELREKFADEWVLLEDPKTSDALEVESGRLLCHSKDRDEVYRKALELKPKHSAVLYTGEFPESLVVVL